MTKPSVQRISTRSGATVADFKRIAHEARVNNYILAIGGDNTRKSLVWLLSIGFRGVVFDTGRDFKGLYAYLDANRDPECEFFLRIRKNKRRFTVPLGPCNLGPGGTKMAEIRSIARCYGAIYGNKQKGGVCALCHLPFYRLRTNRAVCFECEIHARCKRIKVLQHARLERDLVNLKSEIKKTRSEACTDSTI